MNVCEINALSVPVRISDRNSNWLGVVSHTLFFKEKDRK